MIEPCICTLAGHCSRHNLEKPAAWVRLCQTRPAYRTAWDKGTGPGQFDNVKPSGFVGPTITTKHRRYRALWRELHAYDPRPWDPAIAARWFHAWQQKIPGIGCGACLSHWKSMVARTPPVFTSRQAFYQWGVDRH